MATHLYMHTGRWCGIDSDSVVHVHYLFPLALVTRGVLSIGFCDLLRVVLVDGSIAAFFPRLLLGAGDVLPLSPSPNALLSLCLHEMFEMTDLQ
jgi:hypothetical protein